MKKEVTTPKAAYEKPALEVLGSFAQLTLGSKAHALSDLSHGVPAHDGGVGS